ncbi:acetylornithine transaminase [Thermoactinomyces mirandus]|uniref:Acetylornithine aminotransferase n=1 Tax=Thermoactinomyces mirandus TaxID=2756294 RepID=A0A7W2AT89_9BACL|nr:acetylornithine transaminase [Thermoactinomyces mirandus]MBA4603500.1 acetylornithine transaminase [Thermoactinomyces mirandus]
MYLFPTYKRYPVHFVYGEGALLKDAQGKSYLDFSSGIGVNNLGHRNPRVVEALARQAEAVWHVSNLFDQPMQEKVAKKLCEISGLDAVFFCNSGAEANEASIKLARKWARDARIINEPEIITFTGSFHGRTLATLTATGQKKVKKGFDPLPGGFRHVPYGDLEAVKRVTGTSTAGVLLELVQGEGGVRPANAGFVRGLAQWCKEKQILLIVDEVQTGIGRTGDWFAFQKYGIKPDIVSVAKGLGNGFPVGAMIGASHLKSVLGPGSHGTTFGGNPLAMAVCDAVLAEIEQTGLLREVKRKSVFLKQKLDEEISPLPAVEEVRQQGFMVGIELNRPVAQVIGKLLENGLVTLSAGERVLRLLPPLIVKEKEISQAISIIKQTLAPTKIAV